MKYFYVFLIWVFCFSNTYADVLLPIDESNNNKSFSKFKEQFITAIDRKDILFLKENTYKEIKYSFGADRDYIDGFINYWNLKESNSNFWMIAAHIMKYGGAFVEGGMYCSSYVFAKFPHDKIDPTDALVVIDKDVPLRKTESNKSDILLSLNYNIVEGLEIYEPYYLGNEKVIRVRFRGLEGFISNKNVLSPFDYRACFKKFPDGWKLTAFVEGD